VKRIHAVMEHGHGVMWRFRKPGNTTAVFVFFAIVFSLYSLNNCRTCIFQPTTRTASPTDFYEEIERQADFHTTSASSNGFFSPTTLHTIKVEDTDGEIKCMRACSLGLQQTCSELGQRECPAVLSLPARSVVPFEDLTGGDYILRVNCADSQQLCSADPQEYSFHVEEQEETESGGGLRHIPLGTIKLLRKVTGQCSREQVWRSRVTCLGILYTLMGICLLVISHTERLDDEQLQPHSSDDLRWLLQSRARS